MAKDNRWCLICQPKNRTIYWHRDPDTGDLWGYCNKCDRGRSLYAYCHEAGITVADFLKMDFFFEDAKPNEVTAMEWPNTFIPLSDPNAAEAVKYIQSRGLSLDGDMYYDTDRKGIVFPYYFDGHFCGAQIRFITPWLDKEQNLRKIDTIPGTRLGLLFYGWDQGQFSSDVKYLVVTEGAFNALSINQSFASVYGGLSKSPWRAVACSGSGATKHQRDALKELSNNGLKIVVAPDRDEAGIKMLQKFLAYNVTTMSAMPPTSEKDWNDEFKDRGPKQFAEWFISRIKTI